MRRLLFPACFVALCLTAGSRASAQDTPGCDILCRVAGYLTTDHMAAAPSDAEALHPSGPAKPHRSRAAAAARKAAASTLADRSAAKGGKPTKTAPPAVMARASEAIGPTSVAAKMVAAKTAGAKTAVAKPASDRPAPAAVASSRPARVKLSRAAVAERGPAEQPTTAELTPAGARAARTVRAALPGHTVKGRRMAARLPAPPHIQTAAAYIPGSAPTMPANFQPLGSLGFH